MIAFVYPCPDKRASRPSGAGGVSNATCPPATVSHLNTIFSSTSSWPLSHQHGKQPKPKLLCGSRRPLFAGWLLAVTPDWPRRPPRWQTLGSISSAAHSTPRMYEVASHRRELGDRMSAPACNAPFLLSKPTKPSSVHGDCTSGTSEEGGRRSLRGSSDA